MINAGIRKMDRSLKQTCTVLAALLKDYGVRDIVVSPGSRNSPLIVAFVRSGFFSVREVIDERSAAFVGLGIALKSRRPVAVACTSGSALLNYGPAIAEAFYRRVPLIAISADRPACWIDQDDSQTIRQPGAFDTVVRYSIDIPVEAGNPEQMWYVNRKINDALTAATGPVKGPVHINIQLDEPLTQGNPVEGFEPRKIDSVYARSKGTEALPEDLLHEIGCCPKVLVVAGFGSPDKDLEEALSDLSRRPSFAVLAESQSNVRRLDGSNVMTNVDSTLRMLPPDALPDFRPDIVLTCGGALLSRHVKTFLRNTPGLRHYSVGHDDCAIDCFKALAGRIEMDAPEFFNALAKVAPENTPSDYRDRWAKIYRAGRRATASLAAAAPWSDFKAMAVLTQLLNSSAPEWNVQLSNGTAVRYFQLFGYEGSGRIDCNRGVSGIDGCTSTAIGAAMAAPEETTLLVSGDMSAQYDLGAFAIPCIPSGFKMAVLNNGGGGIFRFVGSTSALPELDEFFVGDVRLPLRQLADGFGFRYFEARSEDELRKVWPGFAAVSDAPALLNIVTPGELSGEILKDYFKAGK